MLEARKLERTREKLGDPGSCRLEWANKARRKDVQQVYTCCFLLSSLESVCDLPNLVIILSMFFFSLFVGGEGVMVTRIEIYNIVF